MGLCKDCQHFEPINEPWLTRDCPGVGDCNCDKFIDVSQTEGPAADGLAYQDSEAQFASFRVGPRFGCIHFVAREG